MRPPFVVRVLADRPDAARAVADALAPALAARDAPARIETGEQAAPGVAASIGVLAPDGVPRWITPVPLTGAAETGAERVVEFLARWGFISRAARAPSP